MGNLVSFVKNIILESNQHLIDVNMTYIDHFYRSFLFSKDLFIGSIKACVHSILPCYFTTSTTDIAESLQKKLN